MEHTKKLSHAKKVLNRKLFNAARYCVDPAFREDGAAVRAARDQICDDMFDMTYDQLTADQIIRVIEELEVRSGYRRPEDTRKRFASPGSIKTLRYYSILCAIHYADLTDLEFRNDISGEVLKGNQIKEFLLEKYTDRKNGKGWLPHKLFSHLYNNWINPKINAYLGKNTKSPWHFEYERLGPEDCQKLINIMREITINLNMPVYPAEVKDFAGLN